MAKFGFLDSVIGEQGLKIDVGTLPNAQDHQLTRVADVLEGAANKLTSAVEKSIDFDITIVKRITKLSAELRAFSAGKRSGKQKESDEFDELGDDG